MVNDTSRKFGGLQMIQTNCKKQVPLQYVSGLPYLEQRPPTKSEMTEDDIPHVIMKSKGTWNPRIVDDIETADKMMTQFPPTTIETTDLFYKDNGDIDDTHI